MENVEQLEEQAVDAAMHFSWQFAIEINKKILKLDKKNLAANLRLGFSYIQLQKLDDAKKYYRKALKIQPNSSVANVNLERIKVLQLKSSKKNKNPQIYLDPNLFLEISGKTKSVTLVNLGQKNTLAALSVGQEIFLKIKKRKVEVRTSENEYVGSLPDDLSRRLLVFLKAKSKYRVFVKDASLGRITVFIREEKKGKKVQHYLSFPQNIQSKMEDMTYEKEGSEDTEEETVLDLEKLAETLTSEEKEYLPYKPEEDEEESEE
ncbi:hypothetical protein A3C98_03135 [Candidatus Roizmanbacteria bacterium RIFCSPHIGHO2_02_FULL_37_15]|uniref:Uncharacterized protein n=1 Tax=Candidatus Roizmanbacteria bacterium RIFCSPLOWO2_01_FULL_37_16 TaxID=1802058 RepID=A0A1F7IJ50_9BACT|nr:MAG: hypothetical protein A2859_01195 [Candidatus Roizmanbacteria bacterium RIFCSPHIGHO2_01_FULL_37_16b]OGK21088.1 MAG: hypothetical protein A3C98_03135 [Candidatus Roizmanbacteria bacterium RIFCSPHIGHO2_02_FULL_37_15]OGK33098.1 MAG: hypothetical protein A3F57_06010 [Candidatus Roizmanbacteria bacterium RIFCSPHIGHO2_12_FULL_36_11]OGK43370.1 MAG: hypothetical protein A3B40_01070 [Candidatus Roizmanbacteria bacterium RIFCSPLOWO2_01_FULL_37_16]OGK55645.1 MAG: hypothetical protein A3I50_02835 [C